MTLPGFWSKIHAGNVRVIRDSIGMIQQKTVTLGSGETFSADYIVMCTGWGDHFSMFNTETKMELGLPTVSKTSPQAIEGAFCWDKFDMEADDAVDKKFPFLAEPPKLTNPTTNNVQLQRCWRLYRRSIPFTLAERGDRSLAIMGQIHTVQTPLVSEVQSFWSILYLLGELDLPDRDTMAREIAEWNAWTRKRYLSQGQKFPYSLYDFLPVKPPKREIPMNSERLAWKAAADYFHSTSTLFAKILGSDHVAKAAPLRSCLRLTSRRISMAS